VRFLVDECTGPSVAKWLRKEEHDVFSVFDESRGIDDDRVLEIAIDERRILITNDKGFGNKIFLQRQSHHGVILLRLGNERAANKVAAVRRLLDQYAGQLAERFIVVTETSVRLAGTLAD
jgi:predicted nuclease of predicted toxin-antitoxin system